MNLFFAELPNSMSKLIDNRCTCKLMIKTAAAYVYGHEQLGLCLRSTERSSNRVMHKNSRSVYLPIYRGTPIWPPQKNSPVANDVISLFIHVLSFECCAILWTFECRGSLL